MRNPLDKSSIAQSLDGDRLMGSLHSPQQVFKLSAAQTQQQRPSRRSTVSITKLCVRSSYNRMWNQSIDDPLDAHNSKNREILTSITKIILASAVAITVVSSGALAQQALTGSITRVDEPNGKITIQQTQSGTVGTSTGGTADDFKVQDGLMFNALQAGDKVVFTATDIGGVKTITKLEKQ